MSNLKCCGTCQYFCWSRSLQCFRCRKEWITNSKDFGEYREYWDIACDQHKQEVYRDYDAYTK